LDTALLHQCTPALLPNLQLQNNTSKSLQITLLNMFWKFAFLNLSQVSKLAKEKKKNRFDFAFCILNTLCGACSICICAGATSTTTQTL